MKAWLVREKDEFCAEIIFAETRSKAKVLALSTDTCEDANYIYIEAHRMPQADKYYEEGKWHLDWNNPKDRLILVKECCFICDRDIFDLEECKFCSAKEYCYLYNDKLEEMESEQNAR